MAGSQSGIYEDCEKLLSNYEANATSGKWEFSEFAREWQAMHFELIFSGRQHMAELPDFCRTLFVVAKSFIFKNWSSTTRQVGALFLCYGLYEKQPLKMKLRLTLDELKSVWALVSQVQQGGSLDPSYIFCKLLLDNAFHFCATSRDHTYLSARKKTESQPMVHVAQTLDGEPFTMASIEEMIRLTSEGKLSMDEMNILEQRIDAMDKLQASKAS